MIKETSARSAFKKSGSQADWTFDSIKLSIIGCHFDLIMKWLSS
jgi:hypothetical protein